MPTIVILVLDLAAFEPASRRRRSYFVHGTPVGKGAADDQAAEETCGNTAGDRAAIAMVMMATPIVMATPIAAAVIILRLCVADGRQCAAYHRSGQHNRKNRLLYHDYLQSSLCAQRNPRVI
jgi:zona occludens toxin (predicted ATPase)